METRSEALTTPGASDALAGSDALAEIVLSFRCFASGLSIPQAESVAQMPDRALRTAQHVPDPATAVGKGRGKRL